MSRERCKTFQWSSQGHKFEAELRILPLGGCDIILGHDCMWKYDPVTFQLKKNSLIVTKKEKRILLKREGDEVNLGMMTGKGLKNFIYKNTHGLVAQIFQISAEPAKGALPDVVQQLLSQYADIFQEPKGLPPVRHIEHQIQLKDDTETI